MDGAGRDGIQSGNWNNFDGFMERKKLWEKFMQVETSKDGDNEVVFLKCDSP